MKMKTLLPIAAAFLFASTALAVADDAAPGWGGLYAGAVGDVNFGSTHFALPGDLGDVLQQTHSDHTSFAGGGLLGYSFITDGGTLLGIEGDLTSGNGTSSVTACTKVDGCFTSAHDSFTTLNHLNTNMSWRIRGRVGFDMNGTLLYAAAGYSGEDTKLSLVGLCYNAATPTVPLVFNFARKETLSGYNLGVGAERPLGDHFIVRAEYVFEDFGNTTYKGAAPEWNNRSISVRNSAVRVAVAYQL